mmetsp:Transcript_10765/g.20880  ORF Transcript_10765/g.20880 Transcript_10765/m.20880 type:complete len:84 (-) Transcript_10765:386-637(-)
MGSRGVQSLSSSFTSGKVAGGPLLEGYAVPLHASFCGQPLVCPGIILAMPCWPGDHKGAADGCEQAEHPLPYSVGGRAAPADG